jgi:pimeloyl-ACP methyl ester carboxylesterase
MPLPVFTRRRLGLLAAALAILLPCTVASAEERPLVLVHGINSNGESWRAAADRLQAMFAVRAETPDLSASALYEVQAEQLETRAGAAGSDVVVIGHSNGGVVARQWSLLHPVSALVTVGAPHRGAPLVYNMATYARINLNILSSISDIYRLFGSACCNWQSLLTSYSVWWNLAYDLASSSIVGIVTSLGLTAAQPVLPEMVPGSTYLSGLNSAPNLLREAIVIPARVGIASTAHNFYWGGALRAAFPDHGDEVAAWRDIARLGMDYAASYILAHADFDDWPAFEIADGLLRASYFLSVMDEWWCQTVSVTGFGLCWSNDTIVPEWSQIYPGGLSISTGFDGPAHTQETRMSDALLQSVLATYTAITPRSNDPGDPNPPPANEAMFYREIEFAGEVLGAGGDLPYVGGNWNDRISSVHVPAGRTVVLYEHADYGGNSLTLSGDEADLRVFPGPSLDGTWNDVTSSIRVF